MSELWNTCAVSVYRHTCLHGIAFEVIVYQMPILLLVLKPTGEHNYSTSSLERAASRKRPQIGLSGVLISAELLLRARAQRLQVEVDAILGAKDQLGHLDG